MSTMSTSNNAFSTHLELCITRAKEYVMTEDYTGAIASFLSDARKHESTRHITENATLTILILRAHQGDKDLFIKAMRDFDPLS